MLKKIVKYGNSSALILDKALLELLNMAEGSVVKIKTDGISLTITPQQAVASENVSTTVTIEETFKEASKNCMAQSFGGDIEKAANFQRELDEMCIRYAKLAEEKKDEPEQQGLALESLNQDLDSLIKKYPVSNQDEASFDLKGAQKDFAEVHKKYQHLHEPVSILMASPEYIHEMALLSEKYQIAPDATHSKEYLEVFGQVISRNIPEYADYQNAVKEVGEKHTTRMEK